MYPEMVKRGYPESYAAAVQAIGGTLGIVIPPSIVLVIYGNITGTDVGALLMAGILPGVVAAFFFASMLTTKQRNADSRNPTSFPSRDFLFPLKTQYGR